MPKYQVRVRTVIEENRQYEIEADSEKVLWCDLMDVVSV